MSICFQDLSIPKKLILEIYIQTRTTDKSIQMMASLHGIT